jgi:alpha-L-fucosidase
MPDGRLYPPDAARLAEIAAWMKTNAAGIHGTRGGPYRDGPWGAATCRDNTVTLFLSEAVGSTLTLPKLDAEIRSARRLDGGPLDWKTDATTLRLTLDDRRTTASHPLFTAVQLELDRPAFALPVLDAQPNLAAQARATASSIRDGNPAGFGPQHLLDADGDTAWESDAGETTSTLELDLGETKSIAGLAFAERAQRVGWNHGFKVEIKARATPDAEWQSSKKYNGMLGAPPILALPVTSARYVRIEIVKKSGVALQVAELRLFGPLP